MRTLLPLMTVALLLLVGCSYGYRVADYQGPQAWPTGRASITHTALNNAQVIYGLPERPYEVVQVVEIPRGGSVSDAELSTFSTELKRGKADALVLVGTKYDRMLEVDRCLAKAGHVDAQCMQLIQKVRRINRDDPKRLVFLAIRWRDVSAGHCEVVSAR